MAQTPTLYNEGDIGGNGNIVGHWQPALRPNNEEATQSGPGGSDQSDPAMKPTLPASGDARKDGVVGEERTATGEPEVNSTRPNGLGLQSSKTMTEPTLQIEAPSSPIGLSLPTREEEEVGEIASDEDAERLDPAWGIKRVDSSQILAKVKRSPSFPDFLSQQETSSFEPPRHLPMSQAEDLLQEDHGVTQETLPSDRRENAMFGGQAEARTDLDEPVRESQNFSDSAVYEEEDNVNSGEGLRFEEGLPLIYDQQQQPDLSEVQDGERNSPDEAADPIFPSEKIDDTSFFDKAVDGRAETRSQPNLDRKATTDVLQALHFSNQNAPDSPSEQDPDFFTQLQARESEATQPIMDKGVGSGDVKEDESSIWKAALDDDDEFLVEDADDLLPDSAPDSPSSFSDLLKDQDMGNQAQHEQEQSPMSTIQSDRDRRVSGMQRPASPSHQHSNPYAPHQPSTSDFAQIAPTTFGNVGLGRPGINSMNSMQQQFQRPGLPAKAESFVDQSRGGYKSPYDLPMEIAKPRKRLQVQQPQPPSPAFPPPPRSSSMSSSGQFGATPAQLQSPFSPTSPTFPTPNRTVSSNVAQHARQKSSGSSAPTPAAQPPSTTFFEELPVSSRPRPATGQGRFTPQQHSTMPPPQLLPQCPPSAISASPPARPPPPSQPSTDHYAQYQLQRPERLDPYANVPLQTAPAPVNVSNRYSPAPLAPQTGPRPGPSPRYSPAPPPASTGVSSVNRYASQPTPTSQAPPALPANASRYASQPSTIALPPSSNRPFQPRTSSPLAYFGKVPEDGPLPQAQSQPRYHQEVPSQVNTTQAPSMHPGSIDTAPDYRDQNAGLGIHPPRRSQTQSPGRIGFVPRSVMSTKESLPRPASAHGQSSPVKATNTYEFAVPQRTSVRQRGLSQNLNFVPPDDGTQSDQLERWKGAPIFHFAFGGSMVTSFPKHVPRYSAPSATPMIKPSPGEVQLKSSGDVLPVLEHVASFPGPLKSKSKKKDVLFWLSSQIQLMENRLPRTLSSQLPDPRRRHDEKILLWRLLQILVEYDGILDGSPEVRKAVNMVLCPEVHFLDDASATNYSAVSDTAGIYRPAGSAARSEPVDAIAVDNLRKDLLRGNREKAVWGAVDKRLWAHALLIASTLDRSVWRKVVQEFVRQEVKTLGSNTESLAALYEVFAGNLEESIDQLVPPSARAGLQMVSKVDSTGPTKNALDGLDRWRETLSLILNNRSQDDCHALASLGSLLATYGRIEASHICFLFARSASLSGMFAGADDPAAKIVLLGADHLNQASTFAQDEDAVLLTEVYEFATSVLAGNSTTGALPHLQAYKLQRAIGLAETGRKSEALAYCDNILTSLGSRTKMSHYYSPQLYAELEELNQRLRQAPAEASSWFAKPSVDKVSGSVWNKFTSFVAGDESDSESKGSAKDANYENGPFANVTATPSISRSGSTTDLYGSYPVSAPQSVPNTLANSRYAPGMQNGARSSNEILRTRSSLDAQRSPPSTSYAPLQSQSSSNLLSFGQQGLPAQTVSPYQPTCQSQAGNRYVATPPQSSYVPNTSAESSPHHVYQPQQHEPYVPTPPPEHTTRGYMPDAVEHVPQPQSERTDSETMPMYGGYAQSQQSEPHQLPAFGTSQDRPPMQQSFGSSYEPPADTGYVPNEPEPDSPDQPRKKSFMDDDDEFSRPQPPSQNNKVPAQVSSDDAAAKKRANDAATDAAFRAAAEADAKRTPKTLKPKASGWLGGWLGGKKEAALDDKNGAKSSESKVWKAKLGEESAFYYDNAAKRWVNKKNPDAMQESARATPPPPKGPLAGLSRGLTPSASIPAMSANGPPSGPPSRSDTPGEATGMTPPTSTGPLTGGTPSVAPTPPPGMGLAPPSRPATGASAASSIDDLLGPPSAGGRKSVRSKRGPAKGGRYIDVMGQK